MNIGLSGYFNKSSFGDNLMVVTWKQIFNQDNVFCLDDNANDLIDKIIIGGGGIIDRHIYNTTIFNNDYLKYPTYIYGVGINDSLEPNDDVIQSYNEYFKQCKSVNFRKTYGLEQFYCNYNIVEDIVWVLDNINDISPKTNKIGISLRCGQYTEHIYDTCKYIIESGYDISIISLYNPDYTINEYLYDKLHYEFNEKVKLISYKAGNENDIIKEISELNFYLTQKLHGFIIAMKYNIPSLIIGNMSKFKYITNRLHLNDCLVQDSNDLLTTYLKCFNRTYCFDVVNVIKNKAKNDLTKFIKLFLL